MDGALVLELPEPPSINEMLGMARRRTRRGPLGAWMGKAQTVYWVKQQEYFLEVTAALRQQRVAVPAEPWPAWALVSAEFRLRALRDWGELLGSLKWPLDALTNLGYVADDSPREMAPPPTPTQRINRKDRGVRLVIAPAEPWTSPRP